jgi:hypothetical protein
MLTDEFQRSTRGDRLRPGGFMNRTGRLLLIAGLSLLPLLAQDPGSQKQSSRTTQTMSMHDMMDHMNGMMGRMQGMMPMMQGNQMTQHMMDSMKTMGGNMNQMMNQIQGMMSDQSITQNKAKKQHLEDMSRHMQTMMQSMEGMMGDMEQMQKSK